MRWDIYNLLRPLPPPPYRKKYEKLLIVLPDAVVYPRTVVVHLAYAPLADGTVVGTLRLNTAAFGTFEKHLPLLVAELLDHFLRGVSFRYGTLGRSKTEGY